MLYLARINRLFIESALSMTGLSHYMNQRESLTRFNSPQKHENGASSVINRYSSGGVRLSIQPFPNMSLNIF